MNYICYTTALYVTRTIVWSFYDQHKVKNNNVIAGIREGINHNFNTLYTILSYDSHAWCVYDRYTV